MACSANRFPGWFPVRPDVFSLQPAASVPLSPSPAAAGPDHRSSREKEERNMSFRWVKPEVYPLFVTTGVAIGICAMQLVRNITTNPEVRVTKENRAAGVLQNHDEGRRYSQHSVRRFWLSKRRDYMQAMDNVPTDPNTPTTTK
ncbi:hypothetical protein U9M48_012412 [Paspalum notatum var. saurae]|uniref:B12D-like protein n=1 Tax=Paspalum notatum var. saurae TaxID=547442 RepID=A0AAQ3WII9_PASNO